MCRYALFLQGQSHRHMHASITLNYKGINTYQHLQASYKSPMIFCKRVKQRNQNVLTAQLESFK